MSLRVIASGRSCVTGLATASVLALAAPAALGAQGITYDFAIRSQQVDGGKTKELSHVVGRSQVDGDRARVDLSSVKNGGMMASEDAYVIVTDGGGRMIMVQPKERKYYSFTTEQMMAGMSGALKAAGGLLKMEMSNVKIDVEDLGAGEQIHGFDTRRLRMTQSLTMSVSVFGRKNVTTTTDTTTYWVAPALKQVQNPFLSSGRSAAGMIDFGNPEFRAQLVAANAKLAVGAPLRTESRSVATDEKGKQSVTVTAMEVTKLERGDVPASVFEIPAGYEEVPMPFEELAAMGDSVDAANARGAAPDGGKDAGSEKEPEGARKKLGGLLKKWP
ncbi:MAG TPA: hypothetical protein VGE02_16945 [Gemmatimonadales bacterium]